MCQVVHATNRDRNIQVHYTINTRRGLVTGQCETILGEGQRLWSRRGAAVISEGV